jgi:cobalt-zinc-cadmium efflux system outer membrane protein
MKQTCFIGLMCLCTANSIKAQDTVHITLPEAEKQFLQKNLTLLAEKYDIDIAKAQVIQAKLYNNPTLTLNGNIYNPQLHKAFDVSNKTGQYDIGIQQLIRLAGKRNKEIKLAETAVALSENQFFDLIRTLRYSLRSEFYNISYFQKSVSGYKAQISSLQKMSAAYDLLQAKGVATLKDAVRIKSLLYTLYAEQSALVNQLNDSEASMQLLLQNNKAWYVTETEKDLARTTSVKQLNIQSLFDTAFVNRYDLKAAENNLLFSKQNYALQKALAKTDLTIGADFDKRGSFVENASFLTVAFDLPFFKRNQGNIKASKISIEQSKATVDLTRQTVENDVQRAYVKVLNTDKMLQSVDPDFQMQFEKLLQGIDDNFQKKNISLIEFTDFNESYKNNMIQFNQLQNDKMQAIEALHFAIGKTIFNN